MSPTRLDHRATTAAQAILDAIRRIVRALREASRASEARLGLSAAQLFVLHCLSEMGSACVTDLASRTLTHQSSVSTVASRLAELDLIERERGERDARRCELSLTPRGRALLRRAPEPLQERLITAIARLPADDRRDLARLLGRLTAGIDGDPPPMLMEDPPRLARAARGRQVTRRRRRG
jgi:DNA-binding MarR family transcriptional regulator